MEIKVNGKPDGRDEVTVHSRTSKIIGSQCHEELTHALALVVALLPLPGTRWMRPRSLNLHSPCGGDAAAAIAAKHAQDDCLMQHTQVTQPSQPPWCCCCC
eukprot:511213-Pelagomonas_calceolata.AAC.1